MNNDNDFFTEIRNIQGLDFDTSTDSIQQISKNVEGFERRILATVKVRNIAALRELLKFSNRNKIKIHVVSHGKNWGYGTQLPVENKLILVNLSLMNSIRKIDEFGVAFIEPGVTQKQLAQELLRINSRFYFDVTGSDENTSIVGNSLERGIAYQSIRVDNVVGLKVILADGTLYSSGFSSFPGSPLEGLYPHGLGPTLDGLFFQSNFGIVVEMAIRLKRIEEKRFTLTIPFFDSDLPTLVDSLAHLKQYGVITGIPHIADNARLAKTIAPKLPNFSELKIKEILKFEWFASLSIAGPSSMARERVKYVKNLIKGKHRVIILDENPSKPMMIFRNTAAAIFLSKAERSILDASQELRGLHWGRPSFDGVRFLFHANENAANAIPADKSGFLLFTPLAPLNGISAAKMHSMAREIAVTEQVDLACTLNIISEFVIEGVFTLHFDKRNADATAKSHDALERLLTAFVKQGFLPYRLNINQMKLLDSRDEKTTNVFRKIKSSLDPNDIISPNRYLNNSKN